MCTKVGFGAQFRKISKCLRKILDSIPISRNTVEFAVNSGSRKFRQNSVKIVSKKKLILAKL